MILSRRGLITGLVALVAAPAIVRASSLMPVSSIAHDLHRQALCYANLEVLEHFSLRNGVRVRDCVVVVHPRLVEVSS